MIVKAAFSVCLEKENAVVAATIGANKAAGKKWIDFVYEKVHPTVRETVHDRTVAAILAARSANTRPFDPVRPTPVPLR
jgi:hypothetical protein